MFVCLEFMSVPDQHSFDFQHKLSLILQLFIGKVPIKVLCGNFRSQIQKCGKKGSSKEKSNGSIIVH